MLHTMKAGYFSPQNILMIFRFPLWRRRGKAEGRVDEIKAPDLPPKNIGKKHRPPKMGGNNKEWG